MALTAKALIGLVLQTTKTPGWTAQALELLNTIQADLADTQDLDLCRGTYTGITLAIDNGTGNGSGPYLLPLDYKRAEYRGVKYYYNGVAYDLISIDLAEYTDLVQQAGIASLPEYFATDTSPLGQVPAAQPLLYVWPPSAFALPLSIQYRRLLPDITDTTTVPWFPNQGYLRYALTAAVMELSDDARQGSFKVQAAEILKNFMQLTNDDEGRAKTVKLDRRRFGPGYVNLPNTKGQGW